MHRQLLYVAHDDDLPQERWDSPDLSIQGLEHLSLAEFALGIGIRCRQLKRCVPALGIGVIQLDELGATPLADEHQTLVFDDPQQPCRELGFSVELIDVLECLPACILCFFFPFAVVSQNGGGQVHTSTTMTENQLVKRFSIALLCQSDQKLVRRDGITLSIHAGGNSRFLATAYSR